MRPRSSRALLLASILLALAAASPASAEWLFDALGGVEYDDNVNRAANEADRESDVALSGLLSVGHYLQVTDSASLVTTANLLGILSPEFDGLNTLAPGASAKLRYKFGLGGQAPWIQGFGSAAYQAVREEIRSGVAVTAGVRVGKRLHERFDLQGAYTFDLTEARNSVFSVSGHTASVQGTVSLTSALDLGLEYAARIGDVVVTRSLANPTPAPSPSVIVDTFRVPMLASRINATTYAVSVDLSYALTSRLAATAGYTHRLAQGPKLDYPDNAFRGVITYRY